MKTGILLISLVAATLNFARCAHAQDAEQIVVHKSGQPVSQGSADFFTGAVKMQPMLSANADAPYGAAYVTFAVQARTAWHRHPAGQRLIVISGTAWTQEWNGKRIEAKAGDMIWCPPNIKHWHGASADGEMTHVALTGVKDGENVEWLEKVTDEQYYGH
ncbi:MAG: cupin domain-containing protein [Zoogloeaceae bacterium]|jgi:quercetin dioxygenase-like cupin family protein|nr:cupin domain-containing protein [Zoogloeaceae bacterium]